MRDAFDLDDEGFDAAAVDLDAGFRSGNEALDAGPLFPSHQHFHHGILQGQQGAHHADGADGVDVVGAGLFGFGGALSRQYDAPLGGPGGVDGRFESRDGSWTADEQRLQRLGENHDVAQRQQGKKQRGQNRLRAADYKINIFSTSGRRRK